MSATNRSSATRGDGAAWPAYKLGKDFVARFLGYATSKAKASRLDRAMPFEKGGEPPSTQHNQ